MEFQTIMDVSTVSGEPDPVLHTFQNCSTTDSFHNRVLNCFNDMHNTSISLSNYESLFGIACEKNNNNIRKLNFCLLFANYFFYFFK